MKKIKDYIKKNPEPARGRFGVNPFDPWSTKYNVAEDSELEKSVGDPRSKTVDSPTLQKKNELDKKLKTQKITNPVGSMHTLQNKEGNQNTALTPEEVQMNESKKRMSGADKFRKYLNDRHKEHKKFMDSIKDKPHHEYMQAMMDKMRANLNKEEVEQIDEDKMDKDIIKHATSGMKAQQIAKKLNIPAEWVHQTLKYSPATKPQRDLSDPRTDKRGSMKMGEGVEQMTTAQRIKSIHKKLREDMTDWEKEDKSVQTYGKKPKFEKSEKKQVGENKPAAAAVMTGGTTLTGNKRDDVEIDPMMRNRPGQPDVTNKKKDK